MNSRRTEVEWFIRQVAEGDSALDSTVISHLSEQLGFRLTETPWFCIVAKYAGPDRMASDVHLPVSLYAACSSAKKLYPGKLYSYIGANLYVVMIVAEENDRAAAAQTLYHHISRRCDLPVQFGIGRSYSDLEKLSYSRVEAYEALSTLQSRETVCYIDDIYVSRSITARKTEGQKRRILELFKSGQLEKMAENMANLAEDVRSESPVRADAPYPTSIRRTILEVLFEIMHIAADAGVDVDKLLDYQDPYSRVFELSGGTPVLLTWLSDLAQKLYTAISERQTRAENNMLMLAKRCIHEHISDPELSLSLVSDELEITPSYFSAFFIREVGVGFNEYITGLRMDMAKAMLRDTPKKISTVAAECGFRSASYFIVVFRKQTGISPGEYRNRKL